MTMLPYRGLEVMLPADAAAPREAPFDMCFTKTIIVGIMGKRYRKTETHMCFSKQAARREEG
jgi:hypothetical protein